jgi:hypothetical protein
VAAEYAPNAARRVEKLERTVSRLTWLVAGGGLALAGMWARQQARAHANTSRQVGSRRRRGGRSRLE